MEIKNVKSVSYENYIKGIKYEMNDIGQYKRILNNYNKRDSSMTN